jgi:hypothetical protein
MNNTPDKKRIVTILLLSLGALLVILGTIAYALVFLTMNRQSTEIVPYVPATTIEETVEIDTLKDVCINEPTYLDNGREQYPIDPAYNDLDFLGQLFTAHNCGADRVNEIFGVTDGEFTLGSTIWLLSKPSQDLINTFEEIGYKCAEDVEDEECLKWELLDTIDVGELLKLEPFHKSLIQDDCRNCG